MADFQSILWISIVLVHVLAIALAVIGVLVMLDSSTNIVSPYDSLLQYGSYVVGGIATLVAAVVLYARFTGKIKF